MNKQYKHRKTGIIATLSHSVECYQSPEGVYPKAIIEDSCDWEEVVEKEYGILSFQGGSGRFANLCPDGFLRYNPYNERDFTQESAIKIIKEGHAHIHSIRRNSDGEVFSINDKIGADTFECTKIIGFKLYEHSPNKIWITTQYGDTPLHLAYHKKAPLFFTHDNVPIYEGDGAWYVHKEENKLYFNSAENWNWLNPKTTVVFSTPKAAEDYIAKNKVLFVTEDGVGIEKWDKFYVVNTRNYTTWEGAFSSLHSYGENYLKFSSSSKAQEYIDNNKPMYSKKEIETAISLLTWVNGASVALINALNKLKK